MQETHLKKKQCADILATLKSFNAGDSEMILFEDSRVETRTWDVRCRQLRNEGHLEKKFTFVDSLNPRGTFILCKEPK